MHNLSTPDRYQLLADSAFEHAMIITDNDGLILEWSKGAEKLLGWAHADAVGRSILMIYTAGDRETGVAEAELSAARAQGRSSDVRWHTRQDGTTVFCDGIVSQLLAADGVTSLGFGKILRAACGSPAEGNATGAGTEQRSFVAALLESVDSAIVVCDRHGRITFFNQVARALHGLQEEPLGFERWAEHYHLYRPDGVTALPFDEVPLYRALNGEVVLDAEMVVGGVDGARHHVLASGRPVLDGAGNILGAVVSMHDVSAARDALTARERAEAERLKRLAAEESETRLRKAKDQANLATEAAQLGIWTWDVRQASGTWENARMFEIFNVPSQQAQIRAAHVSAFLDTEDVDRFQQTLDETVQHGIRFHFIGQFRRLGEPSLRWLELTGIRQILTESGAVTVIGTAADITTKRASEEALKEATLRFEATLSAAEVASWIWDIKNDSIIGDRNLTRLFGVADELASSGPLALYTQAIHPADRAQVAADIRRAIDDKAFYSASYRVMGTDGAYRSVIARGRVIFDHLDQPETLAGVTLDITSQTDAQAALRVTQERYHTLIASMDEAFGIVQVVLDDSGNPVDYRFEDVNHALEIQSGLVNAAGRTIREMVPDIEPYWIETYGRVALSRQPERFIKHSAAMGYWWDVYAAPIGEPEELRIAILFSDVTARKKAEDDLRQLAADLSEANRRKTEFLATLAHELRNPLAPVRSGLDLLRMADTSAQRKEKVLEMMDRQLKHMVHLIDDLMEVSRINSGKIVLLRAPTTLQFIVAQALDATQPAIASARHQLEVHLPEQEVLLDADATRMVQVLANLLTNAAKYTPDGGTITLTAAMAGELLTISVQDTGIGIPENEQQRIFDMFGQVTGHQHYAQGGLGIGLALVRSLVAMHGGTVAASSPGVGLGATFTVTLPVLALAVTGCAPLAASMQQHPIRPLTIVIADDNRDAAEALGSLLQLEGHTAHIVHDGIAAVNAILERTPDVALVDIGMPGLNGYEVATEVRSKLPPGETLLAALSGWGGEANEQRAAEAGFDAHLTKPVGLDDLTRLLRKCAERRAGTSACGTQ